MIHALAMPTATFQEKRISFSSISRELGHTPPMIKRPVAKKQSKTTQGARGAKAKPSGKGKPTAPVLDELDLMILHVVDCLKMATVLVPKAALRGSELAKELNQCLAHGYNHLAMYALQEVGRWLETRGKDKTLPPDFWRHLADAAKVMELDAFIPYFLGKADGRTKQTWADVEVSLALLARELPQDLRARHKETAKTLDAYVLSTGKREDGPNPAFMAFFDGLFFLITDPQLPVELDDIVWPIIACNTFEIGLSDGVAPMSFAQVWWRDVTPSPRRKAGKGKAATKKATKKAAKTPAKAKAPAKKRKSS